MREDTAKTLAHLGKPIDELIEAGFEMGEIVAMLMAALVGRFGARATLAELLNACSDLKGALERAEEHTA